MKSLRTQPGITHSRGTSSTARPDRYAKQLASHFSHKIPATWNPNSHTGTLVFNRQGPITGIAHLTTSPDTLNITLWAHPNHHTQLQRVISRHLEHFGAKDNLSLVWHVAES